MLKADLRRDFLARRRSLTSAEVAQLSQAISEALVVAFPVAKWHWLHVFLPIPQQHEPDTWRIIRHVWATWPAVQVAVPVVQPNGRTLRHYHLTSNTKLVHNRWGIPEPVDAPQVASEKLDAVLVPLLAFDETGQRVGYGKGFYDHFLAECRPEALRIGLSLEPPVSRIDDAWPSDVRLHACVTPERVWQFT
ncbi:5-formyltetrahydrofolate cyclo-ligase [Hymenobacter mucosus]|uniref:5-formyltetrahydrofolate cyclo-ligase n=1 Tax=Hymenobacter mucosus TaxID=1411120 RepID=A0A238X173_9BACT|nr:5-formyltetrahydrofolate cyclo-ligase [Hymenobacter mucosus]SNR52512.1 5-formyltetrahydrofolate cyclo-ligase [Hymenobacter mucosus]